MLSTSKLGEFLRETRKSGNHGSVESFARQLGVNKNTLGAYERGTILPELDFLASFVAETGADFMELIRLRLAAADEPATKTVLDSGLMIRESAASTYGAAPDQVDADLLADVLQALDMLAAEKGWHPTRRRRAYFAARLYKHFKEQETVKGERLSAEDRAKIMDLIGTAIIGGEDDESEGDT